MDIRGDIMIEVYKRIFNNLDNPKDFLNKIIEIVINYLLKKEINLEELKKEYKYINEVISKIDFNNINKIIESLILCNDFLLDNIKNKKQSLRKITGSYYTPIELSNFMVEQSLIEFLRDKIDFKEKNLETIDKVILKKLLCNIKIIDPAAGIGNILVSFVKKLNSLGIETVSLINNIYAVELLETSFNLMKLIFYKEFNFNIENLNFINDNILKRDDLDGYFDIVISNPPYVRGERIEDKSYLKRYKVFKGNMDLYGYFFEKGYKLLKEGGILCYLVSNKWLRNVYGEKLRSFIKENFIVLRILDFKKMKHFKAGIDTMIIICRKEKVNKNYMFLYTEADNEIKDLNILIKTKTLEQQSNNLLNTGWLFLDKKSLRIKEKIEEKGIPLKDWKNIKIFRGIKTGFNEIFIVSKDLKYEILNNCKSNYEKERTEILFNPILRGRDIERWAYNYKDIYLITIYTGWTKEQFKDNYEENFRKYYPSLYSYFLSKSNLINKEGRNLFNRTSQGDFWWELPISKACLNNFKVPKIITSDTVRYNKFAYEDKGYSNITVSIIGENLKALIGVLNSSVVEKIYNFYNCGYLGEKTYRIKIINLKRLPIVRDEMVFKEISLIVEKILNKEDDIKELERKIDELVMELYGLNKKDLDFL